jgi:putative nucleotidyltransferase with HDIG domain
MISAGFPSQFKCERLDRKQIESRLNGCPCLPSLGSIDSALKDLLSADQRYTSQIADIIRRDPSLTARLLRLVKSIYYDISTPIKTIEEAVFYLGVRQIRQLAMVTTVIDDFEKLPGNLCFPWRDFWQHCIATALMTREVIDLVQASNGEADYLAGLIHDVGKIAMAMAFPEHFNVIYQQSLESPVDLPELERQVLGMDHAELGGIYFKKQLLPEVFVEVVQCHHEPGRARNGGRIAASVQVADLLVRHAKIGNSGSRMEVPKDAWLECEGARILFGQQTDEEKAAANASLKLSLERIPTILESLV